MTNRGLLGLVVAVATGTLVAASPASGYHIRGAHYTGTHSGGGAVELDVSSDGTEISRFKATNVTGDTCTVDSETTFTPGNGPEISTHTFIRTASGAGLSFEGEFPSKQLAKG